MTWLTWRQLRGQTVAAAAVLIVIAIGLAATRPQLTSLYRSSGLAACHANCASQAGKFMTEAAGTGGGYVLIFYAGLVAVYVTPLLIGLFWGAPLITREIEAGTFRLAWNQSVTRTRWLSGKLGLTALAAMVTAGLLSLVVTWWASPIDRASQFSGTLGIFHRMDPVVFGARGAVPVGYAAFAVALGVTAGILIRRTVPAMATTLAGFAIVEIAWAHWIRPHLIPPVTSTTPFSAASRDELMVQNNKMTVTGSWHRPGAWVLSNQSITPSGKVFTGPATQACQTESQQRCTAWLTSQHLRQLVSYQPASRFWAFQWYETGIFLILAVALAAFCAWSISRRQIA
jgi:hypothetical protein